MKPILRIAIPIALVVATVLLLRPLAVVATDYMWFDGIGYDSVFVTALLARLAVGGGAGLVLGLLVMANGLWAVRQTNESEVVLPLSLVNSTVSGALSNIKLTKPVLLVSAAVGLLTAFTYQGHWQQVLLAIHSSPFNYRDPVHGFDASFYVFTLPLLHLAFGLLTTTVFFSTFVSLAIYFFRGSIRIITIQVDQQVVPRGLTAQPQARGHMAMLAMLYLWCQGAYALLSRYDLMFDQSGLFSGPGYAGVNVTLSLLWLQGLCFVIGGVIIAMAIDRARRGLFALAALVISVGLAATSALPNVVQNFRVKPNELSLESDYLEHHIRATRFAWGMDQITTASLSGEGTLTRQDIDDNQGTVRNIRLWDHQQLLETFAQVQEIRTYYEFLNVDNDRYIIDGQLRQTMLSPRELVSSTLPEAARTWVNESFIYTHGYGLTLGPVNQVNEQGLPKLWIQDLPPRNVDQDDLTVDYPGIYFGEAAHKPVFVLTKNKEFDYPTGEDAVFNSYEGTAGVSMKGTGMQALMALRMGSFDTLLNTDFNSNSRVLLYRNVRERALRVAPFLMLDKDPYLVLNDGRMVWMLDAYTSTGRFPYSRSSYRHGNYLRNSVKITVDAFDGTVLYYRTEVPDPIADAWANVFPDLFLPIAQMPANLRAHVRFPQDLFSLQASLYAIFHMDEAQVFYNREDEWEVPTVNDKSMQPYYTVMKLPGEETEEFILMLPFVPKGRANLAAWMVARADGEHYGEMVAYAFPKDKVIYGPQQVVARINQNDEISEKLSLWNQQGSQAILGTLMVIPVEKSLIYVQPLYLRAASGSIPELKRVIVSYEDKIEMATTLDGALDSMFGAQEVVANLSLTVQGVPSGAPLVNQGIGELATSLQSYFVAASEAAKAGDWARYGEQLDSLGLAIERLVNDTAKGQEESEDTDAQQEPALEAPAPPVAP